MASDKKTFKRVRGISVRRQMMLFATIRISAKDATEACFAEIFGNLVRYWSSQTFLAAIQWNIVARTNDISQFQVCLRRASISSLLAPYSIRTCIQRLSGMLDWLCKSMSTTKISPRNTARCLVHLLYLHWV